MEKKDCIEYETLKEGSYISDNGLVGVCYLIKLDNESLIRLTATTYTLCSLFKIGDLYYFRYNGNVTPLVKVRFSVIHV